MSATIFDAQALFDIGEISIVPPLRTVVRGEPCEDGILLLWKPCRNELHPLDLQEVKLFEH